MKKLYFLCVTLLMASLSYAQTTDLLISKYGEGSASNKFLEIYNGTGAAVDLSGYSLSSCSNGCNTFGEFDFPDNVTFDAGTMLADGDVYVIADMDADAAILAVTDQTFEFLSNGDDAMALTLAGATADTYTIIDILGDLQDDPGSGWTVGGVANGTQNATLTRKTSICSPNPQPLGSFGTDAATSEWNIGASNSGWDTLGSYVGCSTTPVITISSPSDGSEINSGAVTVDVVFSTENAPGGSTVSISVITNGGAPVVTNDVTSPFTIDPTADGDTFEVTVDLVDGGVLASDTSSFSIAYPCDILVGEIVSTCDTETNMTDDTFTTTIAYTGGGTTTYTIDTEGNGTISGDDPSSVAEGTIIISDVVEGTNFTVTFTGDPGNSSCDFTRNITSPVCLGTITCPNVGDVIITEIMKNPVAVGDSEGEYFEVYNTTGTAIDMIGWVISDVDGDMHTIGTSLSVPAMGYAVLGINADSGTNGGVTVNYEYSGVNMSNGSDEVQIVCNGTTIDEVFYTDADFPDTAGVSMELAVEAFDSVSNDTGSNWGDAINDIGSGDLGSPGEVNDFTLSVNTFSTNNFAVFPNPTATGFVNITSANSDAISVVVYDILGKQVINETLNNDRLNVSALNAGVYVLKISQNDASVTKKLVIK